ncbi:sugar ABC transporter substrate-binding protein [Microbacterium limosum]|uniref:Sugar ABC transporter substrate-binding protein n=1 Tax=Microbacterium limosum TaxID=3079935 RepID=A0AAU0MHY5_9MICO|nr:sugar ABC transporter substrate-binding protein [Microbacterium sp. Y20]WOQ69407.1 sugar ABC transporter substrate-binding protein [Microbacterium sp. Y20]
MSSVVVIGGCAPGGGGGESGGDGPITVGVEAGSPWETFFKEKAVEFTAETGIEVEFQAIPHANMRQQFLTDAIAGAGSIDVFTIDQPWLPEFASQGYLVPLDDVVSEEDRADFLPHTLDTVSYDGGLYGLPYMVHNTVLYYRTDLFEAAGLEEPPTTWDEYREYARILTDRDAGIWGTIIPGKQDGEVATRFQTFVKQTGSDIAAEDGAPTIDTPQALEAFDMMTAIQFEDQSSPPGLHDITEIQGQFLEGKVAMVFQWPYMYGMTADPSQSKVVDQVGLAISPGNPDRVSTTFSWGFGVNSASAHVDAATEWVLWATSTDVLTELSVTHVSPVPRESATEAAAEDPALTAEQHAAIATFSDSVAESTTIPMTPFYPQYQDAIAVAVSSVMSQNQDAAAALRDAQATAEAAFG